MKAFIVMPFATEFEPVFSAIKAATSEAGIECVRADQITKPGPIINQIFDEIHKADVVVAEISSKNPNVYYEVALAHCVEKPTVLLANKASLNQLPFDIRHNRVLTYTSGQYDELKNQLVKVLRNIGELFVDKSQSPNVDDFLRTLVPPTPSARSLVESTPPETTESIVHQLTHDLSATVLKEIVDSCATQFSLTDATLVDSKVTDDGVVVTIKDAFGEKVVVLVDRNGIIRRKKKLEE